MNFFVLLFPVDRLTLAFETSCDETCAAVLAERGGEIKVLSNVISSQIEIHKLYGGVVPEIASRNHVMAILSVYHEALLKANVTLNDIAQVAATTHPGLRGAVMVGQVFGESLATARKIPFFAVNHLLGHIASAALSSKCRPPFLSLLISGGHTVVYKVVRWDDIRLICETSDDACGEAFDKTAKILGLGYPGGVRVEELAEKYSGENYITFVANPSKKQGFSYSGLKTAVLTYVNKKKAKGEELDLPLICASFQREVAEELVSKCVAELKKNAYRTLCVCGGVSANKYLRTCIKDAVQSIGAVAYFPEAEYCTDNAAMIGSAAILGARFG